MVRLSVMIVLSLVGVAMLSLTGTESTITANELWPKGIFAAARLHTGVNQLSANAKTSGHAIPVTAIGTGTLTHQFRGGRRTDAGPTPLLFRTPKIAMGHNLAMRAAYNPLDYAFHRLQFNTTGSGLCDGQRQIEALTEYGPVVQ